MSPTKKQSKEVSAETQSEVDSKTKVEPVNRRGKVLPSEKLKPPPPSPQRSSKRNKPTPQSTSMIQGYDSSLFLPGENDDTNVKWNNNGGENTSNIQDQHHGETTRKRKFEQEMPERLKQGDDLPQNEEEDLPWPEEIHRQFVEAIYETGVSHASPSVIMEHMTAASSALTSERVKSHLQKYRKNKEKSKEDFMNAYDKWIQKNLSLQRTCTTSAPIADLMGDKKLLGGDLAAFLTYCVLANDQTTARNGLTAANASSSHTTQAVLPSAMEYAHYLSGGARLPVPALSEEERNSSLGVSMSHVIGLFYSMTNQVMKERHKKVEAAQLAVDTSTSSATNSSLDMSAQAAPQGAYIAPPVSASQRQQQLHHINYGTEQQQICGDPSNVQQPSVTGNPFAMNYEQQQHRPS